VTTTAYKYGLHDTVCTNLVVWRYSLTSGTPMCKTPSAIPISTLATVLGLVGRSFSDLTFRQAACPSNLFRKLDNVYFRDFRGLFTISYKQVRKGRLLNFREGSEQKYRFDFPESGESVTTDTLPT